MKHLQYLKKKEIYSLILEKDERTALCGMGPFNIYFYLWIGTTLNSELHYLTQSVPVMY